MLRINHLKLSLDEAINRKIEYQNLKKKVIKKFHLNETEIQKMEIHRKAIDARKDVHFVYNINLKLNDESKIISRYPKQISKAKDESYQEVNCGIETLNHRPVIIGFGPAGIFAGLLLARRGYHPLILERGLDVDQRTKAWEAFLKNKRFTEAGSILFGEGGAGTFSDGKLTTLVNDLRSRYILQALIHAGADEEIFYLNKPHIGTDELTGVIRNIRKEINSFGGEVRFGAKVTNFIHQGKQLKQLEINHQEKLDVEVVLMATGHSARDTFQVLYDVGLELQQKPFSIGVRIEHPQALINQSQYGKQANHPALGAADYKLSYHAKSGRTAYTFCMCPGGYVVPSISEANTVVTNGMSLAARDNVNANSALLVNVTPNDFQDNHPLAGVSFQRKIEEAAFQFAGANYQAPAQTVSDFLNNRITTSLGHVQPTYGTGICFIKMQDFLPDFVVKTLQEAIPFFDQKIHGFAMEDAILTGPETRSSSPLRMVRDQNREANIKGLYPIGEGAGYAGGIMSSAIDGMKTAEMIIRKYKPQ